MGAKKLQTKIGGIGGIYPYYPYKNCVVLSATFTSLGAPEEVDGVMDMEASGKLNFAVRLWLTEAGTPGRWSLVQGSFHRDFS